MSNAPNENEQLAEQQVQPDLVPSLADTFGEPAADLRFDGTETYVVASLVDDSAASVPSSGTDVEGMPRRPRIWPALVVGIGVVPLAAVISGVVLIVALLATYGTQSFRSGIQIQLMLQQFMTTRVGIVAMIAPGQLVFLAAAIAAAAWSKQPWLERLQLRMGHWRPWTWLILVAATPMIGFLSSAVVSQLMDAKSENLKMLQELFRTEDLFTVAMLYLLIGILPGIAEELLYRGYVQSRLLLRMHPAAAIGISACIFSAAHLDPVHVLGVLPLGIWLGVIAWRTGSLWPAVLGHAANNCLAILMTRWGEVDPTDTGGLAQRGAVVLGTGLALVLAITLLIAFRDPREETAAHV